MKLSRRTFILSGLFSVSGLLYWKTQTKVGDIESFFANYNSIIPTKDVPKINTHVYPFEEELLYMLTAMGVVKTIDIVNKIIKDEYKLGSIQLMNGWVVSETEFKLLILNKKYV